MPLLRPGQYYLVEIWKRSFICTVRPTVHTNPPLKRSSSNRRNLKTPGPVSPFSVDGKHFDDVTITTWFCYPRFCSISLKNKSKITSDCCDFKLLRRSVDRKPFRNFSVVVLPRAKAKQFNQSYPRFIIYYLSNNATIFIFWRFSFFPRINIISVIIFGRATSSLKFSFSDLPYQTV